MCCGFLLENTSMLYLSSRSQLLPFLAHNLKFTSQSWALEIIQTVLSSLKMACIFYHLLSVKIVLWFLRQFR